MSLKTQPRSSIIYGIVALITLILITLLCFIPILIIGLIKLFPNKKWRILCTKGIDYVAVIWTGLIGSYLKRISPTQWEISGATDFDINQWYLVIANHQSWLDIVVLQQIFYKKIPVLKFFIKEQLKWVPLFGFAWWAMGCPFMKRYSKAYLAKKPHKRGTDLISTKKALRLFQSYPSSIISFVEGTRYTPQKQIHQQSPYQNLLKPKAGGIGQVISAMGKKLHAIIDVTILYPKPDLTLWDFLCHRISSVKINIRYLTVPEIFTQPEAIEDRCTQDAFRAWLNEQWSTKDRLMSQLKA